MRKRTYLNFIAGRYECNIKFPNRLLTLIPAHFIFLNCNTRRIGALRIYMMGF